MIHKEGIFLLIYISFFTLICSYPNIRLVLHSQITSNQQEKNGNEFTANSYHIYSRNGGRCWLRPIVTTRYKRIITNKIL